MYEQIERRKERKIVKETKAIDVVKIEKKKNNNSEEMKANIWEKWKGSDNVIYQLLIFCFNGMKKRKGR